ncbi:FG-GAP repeat domain-containing protein [Aestuariimicrobium soli]|uniref:FG-GAP repeat domain-containing protein n=1 Tax=Aestuariimicrobium soli TaxID=2035834 RepID=UPI003EBFC1A4
MFTTTVRPPVAPSLATPLALATPPGGGATGRTRRRPRLAAALAGTAIVAGATVFGAAPAHAVGVEGPYTTFGDAKTFAGISVKVSYPERIGDGDVYENQVTVCNISAATIPVGPENFSWSRTQNASTYYAQRDTPVHRPLPSVYLARGACVSGALANSGGAPWQLAFHQPQLGLTVDIVPATEFDGTYEPASFPKAVGATHRIGDYVGDAAADVHGTRNGTTSLYRTLPGPSLVKHSTVYQSTATGDRFAAKVGDLDSNGMTDVLTVTRDGRVLLARAMEGGRLALPYQIGHGFQTWSLFGIVPGNDAGAPTYLVGRNASGQLVRYTLTVRGLSNPRTIGTNWSSLRQVVSLGDLTGDGLSDLMAIRSDGRLYRYAFGPSGSISSVALVGGGWQTTTRLVSPGDLNRDGRRDLVAVRTDGGLYFYASAGNATFGVAKQIGQGWGVLDTVA